MDLSKLLRNSSNFGLARGWMRKGCLCALAVEVLLDRPDSKSADWRWTDGVAVVEVEGGGGGLVESDKACSGSGWLPENQKNVVILAIFFAYFRLILQHCLHYFDLMYNESIVLKTMLWSYLISCKTWYARNNNDD